MHQRVIRDLPATSGAYCYFHGMRQIKRGRRPAVGWRSVRNPRDAFANNFAVARRLEQIFSEAGIQIHEVKEITALIDDSLVLGAILDPGVEAAYFLAGYSNTPGWAGRFQEWLTGLEIENGEAWHFFREEICDGNIRVGAQKKKEGHILLGVAWRGRSQHHVPGKVPAERFAELIEEMAIDSAGFGDAPMPFTPEQTYLYNSDDWHPADLRTLERFFPGLSEEVKRLETGDATYIEGSDVPARLVVERLEEHRLEFCILSPR